MCRRHGVAVHAGGFPLRLPVRLTDDLACGSIGSTDIGTFIDHEQ